MRERSFGRLGWPVSEVGYGMWGMGGWTGSDDAESLASLDRAVALGCNFFDTAFAYGDGHSEELLGQTLRRHPGRRLYVATKVPPKDRHWPGLSTTPPAEVFPYDHVVAMTEKSAANLGVERIDLQQLHVWSDAWVEDDGWRRAAEDLKRRGLVLGFGISVNRWEPENVLKAIATGLVDSVQVVYNVFDQAPEDVLFPACQQAGTAVIARVPFDEGSLTGALRLDSAGRRATGGTSTSPPSACARHWRESRAFGPSCRPGARCLSWPCVSSSTTRPSRPPSRACGEPRTWRPTSRPGTRRRFRSSCWKACGRTAGSATGACRSRLRLALLETVE